MVRSSSVSLAEIAEGAFEDGVPAGLQILWILLDGDVEVVRGAVKIRIVERGLAHGWSLRRR